MARVMILFVLAQCLWFGLLNAQSLEEKYPSYAYVFGEFDVEESYIYNDDFISFASEQEQSLNTFYRHALQRGKEILPTMQGMLLDDGVSDLFIYLSIVESGLVADAVSPKKAVGLWQFMPKTAKHYDLTVCDSYDERCDTQSSTLAAIQYLNKLHKQFGKWYLAAMAYNCGEGCVQKAISSAGTDDFGVLSDENLKFLPQETRAYMRKILLIAMMGENVSFGDFQTAGYQTDLSVIKVEVKGGTTLKSLAALLKMPEKALKKLNKVFKNQRLPREQKTYEITIPLEKAYAFYLRYDLSEKPATRNLNKTHLISHHVSLGDSLESIAKEYGADVDEIKVANHLKEFYLTVGDLLVVPVSQEVFEGISH